MCKNSLVLSRAVPLIAFAILLLVGGQRSGWALPVELSLKQKIAKADVVALVQVRSKTAYPKAVNPLMRQRAILRVVTVYKGKAEGNEVTVSFGGTDNRYAPNETWLVFLKRGKPSQYTTLNGLFGQMEPWERLVDRLRALTGPGNMMGTPLENGQPLTMIARELNPGDWGKLRISALAPGMTPSQAVASAGKPTSKTNGGSWWFWRHSLTQVRFDKQGKIDLVAGPKLFLKTDRVLRALDQDEAAKGLGKPASTVDDWQIFQHKGVVLAIRIQRNRLTYFCLAAQETTLRENLTKIQAMKWPTAQRG